MDVGLDFGGGGYSLQGQLDKIDYDMTKAGFPKSAIFLALHNECKKHQAKELSEHHLMQYKKHRDIEEWQAAKDNQPQAYQSLSYAASLVPKHFPPDSAKKNSDAFSGYDVSPYLYNSAMMGMFGAAGAGALGGIGGTHTGGLVGDKFYGKGLAELIKGLEPSSSIEFQQSVLNQFKKDWGGGSDKAPPPAPKPKQVDSVPDHGGARRFRHEDD